MNAKLVACHSLSHSSSSLSSSDSLRLNLPNRCMRDTRYVLPK